MVSRLECSGVGVRPTGLSSTLFNTCRSFGTIGETNVMSRMRRVSLVRIDPVSR